MNSAGGKAINPKGLETLRMKFECTSVVKLPNGQEQLNLAPVYDAEGDTDQAKIWSDTPNAMFALTITNTLLQGSVVPGARFYLDLTHIFQRVDSSQAIQGVRQGAIPGTA